MLITANYMILTVFPEPFKGWSDMINHRVSVVEVMVDIRSQNDRMNNSSDWLVRSWAKLGQARVICLVNTSHITSRHVTLAQP